MSTDASTGRLREGWAPRLDARLLVGLVLVAAALAGGISFWSQARVTEPVVVAARDIPAGHVLTPDDLTVTEARLKGRLAALAIPGDDLDSLVGRTSGSVLHAGELLVGPDLTTGPAVGPGEVAVTLPVETGVVYPELQPGDEVAVLATSDRGKPDSRTLTLLDRAVVFEVGTSASRVTLGGRDDDAGPPANVTLVVPRMEAERVAHALVNETLTLVLLAPSPAVEDGN